MNRFSDVGGAMGVLFSGGQIGLNAEQLGAQAQITTAALPGGGFASAWVSTHMGSARVVIRSFGPDGTAQEAEVPADDAGGTQEASPIFFESGDGALWLAWTSVYGGQGQVCARRYDGESQSWGEVQTLVTGLSAAQDLSACALNGGGFALAYTAQSGARLTSFVNRFDPSGQALGASETLAVQASSTDLHTRLVDDGAGGFFAFWEQKLAERNIVMQHFTDEGRALPVEAIISPGVFNMQFRPQAVTLENGDLLVLWQQYQTEPYGFKLHARRFSATGEALGDVMVLPTGQSDHADPCLVALSGGGFAVAWTKYRPSSPYDCGEVHVQFFGADDAALGPAMRLHGFDTVDRGFAELTLLSDGRLLVSWQSNFSNPDGIGQILDPRLVGAEDVHGADARPRLLAAGATLEVTAGAALEVWNQHALQCEGATAAGLTLRVAGRIGVGGDIGSFDGVSFLATHTGDPAGAGWHQIEVTTSGAIVAHGGAAIRLAGGQNAVLNAGLLEGADAALIGGEGADHIVNHGTIRGDVLLGGGDDFFDGRGGVVDGVVKGGVGDDAYLLSAPGMQIEEAASGGFDRVQSLISYRLAEGLEALVLLGTAALSGFGNGAANHLFGNAAANRMHGEAGDDQLWGQGGADRLWGAAGRDTMAGGAGGDDFVFTSWRDSPRAAPDIVTDFRRGLDDIDLHAMAGPRFEFEGKGPFSGEGPSVRLRPGKAGLWVEADVNGDGRADFALWLQGVKRLTAEDFLL